MPFFLNVSYTFLKFLIPHWYLVSPKILDKPCLCLFPNSSNIHLFNCLQGGRKIYYNKKNKESSTEAEETLIVINFAQPHHDYYLF